MEKNFFIEYILFNYYHFVTPICLLFSPLWICFPPIGPGSTVRLEYEKKGKGQERLGYNTDNGTD